MTAPADIRPARPDDAPAIAEMLVRMGEDLNDPPSATEASIRADGFGPAARFSTLIAEAGGRPVGFALYFPHYSTTRGGPGAYVQDVWTAPEQRGQGLGAALLAAVAARAARDWGAGYLALSVHGHNAGAERLYARLGFTPDRGLRPMALTGARFTALAAGAVT
ncbi:GNAT family N-acetyltransferase [Sinisalibacter lacisalsi]|uniref:N-acetyltransferase n=1 Tax=Sinisalibacter lacisalsi TaxID=1526570 RepID=A0ABQ1QLI4_9RHOB|nr:GNAT family N-acetyltransferase [Sinisalibacter lacisalsi]GGD30407.1 N-acetyltransferase [Sinisalibacter lacisalsi]